MVYPIIAYYYCTVQRVDEFRAKRSTYFCVQRKMYKTYYYYTPNERRIFYSVLNRYNLYWDVGSMMQFKRDMFLLFA